MIGRVTGLAPSRVGSLCAYAALGLLLNVAAAQTAPVFLPVAASCSGARFFGGCSTTLLNDGTVLFIDLSSGSSAIFDPLAATLTPLNYVAQPGLGSISILLPDGRVLFAAGSGNSAWVQGLIEIYDPATKTFDFPARLPVEHSYWTAALLGDGRVLFAGDDENFGSVHTATVEIFDPATGLYSSPGDVPMFSPVATPLPDGRVLLVGINLSLNDNVALIYDPAINATRPTGGQTPYSIFSEDLSAIETETAVFDFSTVLLRNGTVLLPGGWELAYRDNVGGRGMAEIYDPATGQFHQTGNLPQIQGTLFATALPGGRALVGGGQGEQKGTALYDPVSGSFSLLNAPAAFASATLLADGTVLLPGASLWLFVPPPSAVSSASLTAPLAPESFASIFGGRLAAATETASDPQSPPSSLGGIGVKVRDSSGAEWPAPLLYVSPSQINFEVPSGVVPGNATVEIQNGGNIVSAAVQVNRTAPGLFSIPGNIAAAYGTRLEPGGSHTVLPPDTPIVLDERPVYLSLFGTGIRGLSPQSSVRVAIGALDTEVSYAGAQGTIPCLDQVNVLLPAALKGAGKVPVALTVDGVAANQVLVEFE